MIINAILNNSKVINRDNGDKEILLTLETADIQAIRLLQLPADTLLSVTFDIEETEA